LGPIPTDRIVVSTTPQIELLKGAVLGITHAGVNTALETLAQGVPMVAIPIGFDQPGVAARIALPPGKLIRGSRRSGDRTSLRLIQRIRNNPSYRVRARYFQKVIAETEGLDLAAEVIEQAFKSDNGRELVQL
jgi:UDP:flavonoid glycosyltransferase YjiC (YdhE family)